MNSSRAGKVLSRLFVPLFVLVLLAACSSEDASQDERSVTNTPPTPTTASDTASAASVPGRPDAPASESAGFRDDPASVVAATGNPQLLEFFTYW
jgi:uncharacterized lipoprotein YajG